MRGVRARVLGACGRGIERRAGVDRSAVTARWGEPPQEPPDGGGQHEQHGRGDGVEVDGIGQSARLAGLTWTGTMREDSVDVPKLDGPRAQLHILEHRTVHAFRRPGRELIRLSGLSWLRELRWPVASAVLDGEAVAGDGSEDIQAVFEARTRPHSQIAFTPFHLLELDARSALAEPWTARRKRLEGLVVRLDRPRAIPDHLSFAGRACGGE